MTLNQVRYNKIVEEDFTREQTVYMAGSYEIYRQCRTNNKSGDVDYYYSINEDSSNNRYLPPVSYDSGFFSGGTPKFEIQTIAYGALGVDEIRKVMAGYQEAVELVELLTKSFC